MEAILVAATPPVIAALIAALGVWLRRRTRHNRAQRALAEASSRIGVIRSWLEAHRELDPSGQHEIARRQALEDLEKTYALISVAEKNVEKQPGASSVKTLAEAVFLLDTHTSSWAARTVQILYYVSLVWVMFWLAAACMFGLGAAVADTADSLAARLVVSVGITVLCLAIGLAPALLLYLVFRSTADRLSQPSR